MKKRMIFGVLTLAAIAFTGCSKDEGLASSERHDDAFNTTSLFATREGSLSTETGSKTVTTIDEWKVAWSDGTNNWFGTGRMGLNCDVDYIAFLKTDNTNPWGYLTNSQDRQLFVWKSSRTSHPGHPHLDADGCCAAFGVALKPGTTDEYFEGLEPNVEYYGYYFMPFVKDKTLPILTSCQSSGLASFISEGYNTVPFLISEWELGGQNDDTIQRWLAVNDILQACPHQNPQYNTIKATRDGRYDATTNSYVFDDDEHSIDMKHSMALVEVDVVFANSTPTSQNIPLHVVKIIGRDASENGHRCFDSEAALDENGAWDFNGSDAEGVSTGTTVQCTRTDINNTKYSNAPVVYANSSTLSSVPTCVVGKKCLKFFMLVRHNKSCDHYAIQVFSGTNYREIKFYPGTGFRFQPGSYYRFVVEANTSDATRASQWQSSATATLTPLYPDPTANSNFWVVTTTSK